MSLYVATVAALLAQLCLSFGYGPVLATFGAIVVTACGWRSCSPSRRLRALFAPAAVGAALGTSAMLAQHAWPADDLVALLDADGRSSQAYEVTGDVTDPPKVGVRGVSALITVHTVVGADRVERPVTAGLLLSVRHATGKLRFGHTIRFTTRLRRIANLGNPGEFDFAAWCERHAVAVSGFVWRDDEIADLGPASAVDAITFWRGRIAAAAAEGRGAGGALTASLVVGDRSGLDANVLEALRIAGLFHLLAISGMHIAVVAGFALWATGAVAAGARVRESGLDPYRPAAAVAAASVVLYAMLSGGGDSVARATIMGLLMLVALWRGDPGDGALGLAGAALVLSVIAPGGILDVGFQLTFVATAAVLAAVARVSRSGCPKRLLPVMSAMVIALWCWAVTTPIVAYHFHRVSLVAPVAGLAASPAAAVVVVSGLIGSLLLPVMPHAASLAYDIGGWAGDAVLWVARIASSPHWAEQLVVSPGAAGAFALAALPLIAVAPADVRRRTGMALCCVLVGSTAHAAFERYRSDRMDVVFASVGQGDATIVRLPGGKVLVADAGPPGRGRTVVGPMLRRMHIGRIDYFIATHGQDDHVGGLMELATEFPIGELWYPGGPCAGAFLDVVRDLEGRGTRIVDVGRTLHRVKAKRGPRSALVRRGASGWRLAALWPRAANGDCAENDRSVVARLDFLGARVLLTGDIEAPAEAMLSRGKKIRADLLKVAHHGSRTSSTPVFLAAVQPLVAVASLGWGNRFHFPSSEVVGRYETRGVRFFRTDRDGAVHATLGRAGLLVEPSRDAVGSFALALPAAAR